MKSSACPAILCILLVVSVPVYPQIRTTSPDKTAGGSISGKVTIKGKGAAGITLSVRATDSYGQPMRPNRGPKGVTDQDGNYEIKRVPPGTYQVMPAAAAFVISGLPGPKSLLIAEGEAVDGVDFALVPGGVITGKASDADGKPLIEEQILLLPAEGSPQSEQVYAFVGRSIQTDDRGIYRIFGIPQGRYKVALGQSGDGMFAGSMRRTVYKQTFYPSVTDPAKATVIEVTEGSEATNVDITVVTRELETFAVSGRIVDGDSGKTLPNVRVTLQTMDGRNSYVTPGAASNSQGEFKVNNLTPGKYALSIFPDRISEFSSDAVPFEIIDQNIQGLLLKTSRGASLSGVVIFEGPEDKAALAKFSQMELHAHVRYENEGGGFVRSSTINPDGSFRVAGLQAGIANFSLAGIDRRALPALRIERDGIVQPSGVEIKAGEDVTGIRVLVTYGNGTIRGNVKLENGELPSTARFSVWLVKEGDDPFKLQGAPMPSPQVDSRGHFLVEGLLPGTYEVNAVVYVPESSVRMPPVKQQVIVSNGVVTEVTLTWDLSPNRDNP